MGFCLPNEYLEHKIDSPKGNMWCALSSKRVIGPFFFAESTINNRVFFGMLENYTIPQLKDDRDDQQSTTALRNNCTTKSKQEFFLKGVKKRRTDSLACYSPELTTLDFEDTVCATKPHSLEDLHKKIRIATESINPEMLQNTRLELAYILDTSRLTHYTITYKSTKKTINLNLLFIIFVIIVFFIFQ